MERENDTFPTKLCLLCRSTHGESLCKESQDPCIVICNSTTTPRSTLSRNYVSSSPLPGPPSSSHSDFYRTNSIQSRSRGGHNVLCSKLFWMFTLTAVLAVSSAASIAQRNTDTDFDSDSLRNNGTEFDQTEISGSLRKNGTEYDQTEIFDSQRNSEIIGTGGVQDVDTAEADNYLESFGYYHHRRHHQPGDSTPDRSEGLSVLGPALPGELHRHHTPQEREKAIRRLQRFFHLRDSGRLDEETKKIMGQNRCGVKDIIDDDDDDDGDDDEEEDALQMYNAEGGKKEDVNTGLNTFARNKLKRRKRYAFLKYKSGSVKKWRLDKLTWRLEIASAQLNVSDQKAAITRALDTWGAVIPIELSEETGDNEADVRLLFGSREHGPKSDPAFDGRASAHNTLAHAWGPYTRAKGFPGDVHFDEDDDWSSSDKFFATALHELGHSFGLLHSEDMASIMFPVYQNLPRLGQDDLDAVDFLYGPGSSQKWKKKSPQTGKDVTQMKHFTLRPEWITRPPTRGVKTCGNVTVEAFLPDPSPQSKNFFIAVSGDRVHRVSPTGKILQSESLQSVFPDLPESPDVGLSVVQDEAVFFIKGELMWGYKQGSLIEGFPRPIKEMGFPEQPQYSISLHDEDGNHTSLLFGNSYWWVFDSQSNKTERYDPIRTFSKDLPDDVLFVTQWSDRRLYAVSNDSYVVLDSIQRTATHENRIHGNPDWLTPLCEEIEKPIPVEDFTIEIISGSAVAGCFVLLAIVLIVYKFVQFYRKNYSDYI